MRELRWVFATPTLARPTGGDIAVHELASALARADAGSVHLVHVPFGDERVRGLDDIPWARFDPRVEHTFSDRLDPDDLPDGDVVVYTMKLVASALGRRDHATGSRLIDVLSTGADDRGWLPVLFVQGLDVFGPEVEELAVRLPGAKVCVGSALVDALVAKGVARSSVACIPNGLDHTTFRVLRPVRARQPGVALNYDPHPVKAGEVGVRALGALADRSGVPAIAFGTRPPAGALPDGVRFVESPTRSALVDDIYNASTMYLQPSQREGFGMCAVEAMACGCALVTTANGGSDDYAHHEETALICETDPDAMTDALARLAGDDALRVRLAEAGARFVARFRWETSAKRLTELAAERLSSGQ